MVGHWVAGLGRNDLGDLSVDADGAGGRTGGNGGGSDGDIGEDTAGALGRGR